MLLRQPRRRLLAGACGALLATVLPGTEARAEVGEIRMSVQYGLSYLPFMVMEHFHLLEKQAKAQGLGDVKVAWTTISSSASMMDAMLAGEIDFITPGVPTLATMWDKTVGMPMEMRALGAIQSMNLILLTRDPKVKSIADFTDADRIAVPSAKISAHAIALEMAAAQKWGPDNYAKLDHLTVTRPHPNATTAILSGKSEVNSHFASPPYYFYELSDPAVHKVITSFDVLGAKHTNGVIMTSKKFYDANPRTCAAVVAALQESDDYIKAHPHDAAELYNLMSHEKRATADQIETMITSENIDYTTQPIETMKFVVFLHNVGRIKHLPKSWKDLFFPTAYGMNGS